MWKKFILVFLACWLATAGAARAQTLNQEMSGLADKLSKALVAQGFKNVAAVDFTDLQGQPTELGRYLSERVAVEIVSAGGVSMVDRANIKSILAEHKLTEEGLVNPANAKKLGEFAGVDAILIGNVTALEGIELMVKAISTDSAKIVAAGRITFPKTSDIQLLLNRGISSNASVPSATAAGSGTSYQDANAIATKDIGSLRVVLKSTLPMKLKDRNGQSTNGIRCSFEFTNRETQKVLVVALNAVDSFGHNWTLGDVVRTTLLDDRGRVWTLPTVNVTGVNVVSVGLGGWGGSTPRAPTEIVSQLQRQDEMGTNMVAIEPGRPNDKYAFVFGSTTEISPGQSVTVSLSFAEDAGDATSGAPPKSFQIVSEIVVGVAAIGSKPSYSLHNLTFDQVRMPAGG
ncbi:MAG TPA: FlgO family outer membrane protein [Thermoanaerobaculia bacterium]|nr:FlgO family outer membrane protein [Thermoanaerobaculia bacterium]